MDAMMSCTRWHGPHKVFPMLGVLLLQPDTLCGVMLGRILGPLSQESDIREVSESITAASAKPGHGLSWSPGLVSGRWQYVVVEGGKLAWGSSTLSVPSQNMAGSSWMVREGGSGWEGRGWDAGRVLSSRLPQEDSGWTCGQTNATISVVAGWEPCPAHELEHDPSSQWGDSAVPPGYFTLNTAKGWVLPLFP